MSFKRTIANAVEHILGVRIFRTLPRGVDICHDLADALPDFHIGTVFDVGANIGQSTRSYLQGFSRCNIYSFEPVRTTFESLQNSFATNPRVNCFCVGFGDCNSAKQMLADGTSSMNYILEDEKLTDRTKHTEEVALRTVDSFCEEFSIPEIDFLKIDTEGWDLNVLRGATQMLTTHQIGACGGIWYAHNSRCASSVR
jgi:FkbM family methyltransferase